MSTTTQTNTRDRLDGGQRYKLYKLIEERNAHFAGTFAGKTFAQIAAECSKELGIDVNSNHVSYAFEILGIEKPRVTKMPTADEVEKLKACVTMLAEQIVRICDAQAIPVSKEIVELAGFGNSKVFSVVR